VGLEGVAAVQLGLAPASTILRLTAAWTGSPSLRQHLATQLGLEAEDLTLLDQAVKAASLHLDDPGATWSVSAGPAVSDPPAPSPGAPPSRTPAADLPDPPDPPVGPRYGPPDGGPLLLGEGGMGRVEAVQDLHLGRTVARKVLLDDRDPARRARFAAEARITGQLEHPGIVPVYELGWSDDGRPYYTMRRVAGRTLAATLSEAGDLAGRLELLGHFTALAQAMAFAHSRGVVHRDLKPSNVMIGDYGETLLLDWGLAATLDSDSGAGAGQVMGTPAYMSPEQALGRHHAIGPASDTWSLGVMLYELLTGQRAFTGATSAEVVAAVRIGTFTPVLTLEADCPPELAAVCRRCLSRRSEDRPTVAELVAELQAWERGLRLRSYDYSARELLVRFVRRNPALSLALVGLLSLAVAAATALGLSYSATLTAEAEARAAARHAQLQERAAQIVAAEALTDSAERALAAGDALGAGVFAVAALTRDPITDPAPDTPAWARQVRMHSAAWAAEAAAQARFRGVYPLPAEAAAGGIRALRFAPDGSQLAALATTGPLVLWDLATDTARVLDGGSPLSRTLGDIRFSAAGDSVFHVGGQRPLVHQRTGPDLEALQSTTTRANPAAIELLTDRGLLAIGTPDGLAGRVWLHRLDDLSVAGSLSLSRGRVVDLALGTSADTLVVLERGGQLSTWGLEDRREAWHLDLPHSGLHVAVDPTTGLAAVPGTTAAALSLVLSDGSRVDTLTLDEPPHSVAWWGGHLVHGGEDRALLRDLDGTPRTVLHTAAGGALYVSADLTGTLIATAGRPDEVRLWERVRSPTLHTPELPPVVALAPWPDGAPWSGPDPAPELLAATEDAIWTVPAPGSDTAPRRLTALDTPSGVRSLVVHPAGHTVVVSHTRGQQQRIDLETLSRELWEMPPQSRPFGAWRASFSPDGTALAWPDRTRGLLRAENGQPAEVVATDLPQIWATAWSPDSRVLAAVGYDGHTSLHPRDGGSASTLSGDHGLVQSVAFDPSGTTLATANGAGEVRLWTLPAGPLRLELDAHTDWVPRLSWSADGQLLLTVSHDASARIWRTSDGAELRTIHADEAIHDGLFDASGEGLWLVEGETLRWHALRVNEPRPTPAAQLAEAEARAGVRLERLRLVPTAASTTTP